MRLVRIGLGNIDTTVGAFRENTDRALAVAHDMAADGVTIGVFPEQAIGGYPVEDLIQWQGFVDRQWPELERFARETAGRRRSSSSASPSCTTVCATTARRRSPAASSAP